MRENIEIQNLKCGGCANTIKSSLGKIEGISHVVVDNVSETVSFEYSDYEQLARAKKALSRLGYPPVHEENTLGRKMTSLASCVIGRVS